MRTFLITFFAFLGAMLATIAVIIAVLSYRLHRRNRVAPDVETLAPLTWLSSPSQAARLHRRLRAAVAPVHVPAKRRPAEPDRRTELCRTLVAEAVEIDHHLVLAARQPGPRRREMLRVLEGQVAEVERLALRLGRMRRILVPGEGLDPHGGDVTVLADLRRELDLLDEAHAELLDIERANGLLDPTPLLHTRPGPPPTVAPVGHLGPPTAPPAQHVTPTPTAAPVARTSTPPVAGAPATAPPADPAA